MSKSRKKLKIELLTIERQGGRMKEQKEGPTERWPDLFHRALAATARFPNMNKQVYQGLSKLEISTIVMHEFG